MPKFIEITAKDNPLIKLASTLQSSAKARKEHGLFALEGLRICKDAVENSIGFDKLIITKAALEKHRTDIEIFAENSDKCYILPDNLFKRISDTDSPQGIIALAKIPNTTSAVNQNGKYIALENIADPSNLGAVARTAEALGIDGIVLTAGGCDPYSPKSLRSSMGTLLRLPLYITDDITAFIKANSLRAFACVVAPTAEKIGNISFKNGDILLIGNEANGLTEKAKSAAYKCITIPMRGRAESLNAAAAASIAMWEMVKCNDK